MAGYDGRAVLISFFITAAAYTAFPLIYGLCKPNVSRKKYRLMCFLVNFGVHTVLSILAGGDWNEAFFHVAPYLLWTGVLSTFLGFVLAPEGQGTAPEPEKNDGPKPGLKKPEAERVPGRTEGKAEVIEVEVNTAPVFCRYCGASIERTAQFCPYCKKTQMLSMMADHPEQLNGDRMTTDERAREIVQEEIAEYLASFIAGERTETEEAFIAAVSRMRPEDWHIVEKIIKMLHDEMCNK